MYEQVIKRGIDILVSVFLLLFLIPLFMIVALLIKIDTEGPVFFLQQRVGKDFKIFTLYKFRTMTDEKREVAKMIGKAEGVTKIGYFLRRFKIDELPQLINVLMGEMSLVGPRPSIEEQLEEMNSLEKKRYSVRPGMTGLAQVCGNIHISWSERYKYDLRYVNNISFRNDVKIILRTVLIVIKGEKEFINCPLEITETT